MNTFRNLSKTQLRVFEQIISNNNSGHPIRTLKSLECMGLIESYVMVKTSANGTPPVKIKLYEVPHSIYMEWCQWNI